MKIQKYEIIKEIYRSEHSFIYKARDHSNGELVAIKEFVPCQEWENSSNESDLKRFFREYEFLTAIDSSYVVKVFDYIEQNKKAYIVMEFIDGVSLESIIEEKISLSLFQKLQLGLEISEAIQTINDFGLVHRDIKPENIMICWENLKVKIIDLGIGKFIDKTKIKAKLTNTEFVLGTCAYMSPEQCFAKVTAKSDIFSLGITLYQVFFELLESPFDGKSVTDIFMNVLLEDIENINLKNISSYEQIIYDNVYQVLKKATEKFPHRRWNSIKEMTKIFRALLDSTVETAPCNSAVVSVEYSSLCASNLPSSEKEILDILLEYGQFFYRQYDFGRSLKAFIQILKVFPDHELAATYYQKTLDKIKKLSQKNAESYVDSKY